jgi:hypothetical protein
MTGHHREGRATVKLVALLPLLACGAMMFVMAKMMMSKGGSADVSHDAEREALRVELERLRAERDRMNTTAGDG